MNTSQTAPNDPRIDHAMTLDCIHCGLCLSDCPTYRLTGVESSGPRGRIHLMRAVAEGHAEFDASVQEELNSCLLCRNCESVCPSGVEFGAMMGKTREHIAASEHTSSLTRLARTIGFRFILPNRGVLRLVSFSMRLIRTLGLHRLLAGMLGARGAALNALPAVPRWKDRAQLPGCTPAIGEKQATAAVLEGCVMPELLGRVNRATVRVLSAAGVESRTADHTCCGSLHAHNGDLEGARALARETMVAFDDLQGSTGKPLDVVVNSAGCASHMKEYGHLFEDDPEWRDRAAAFSKRVFDFSEYLSRPELTARLATQLGSTSTLQQPVVFDDPCHLCHGQGIRSQPRELIDLVPGIQRTEVQDPESCCGSAGIYSLLRPEASRAILSPRLDAFAASGARTLVTANPGCQLQWQSGFDERDQEVEVLHVAELLERGLKSTDSN